MENKYYTPEITEFHVGFEFEFQGVDNNWSPTGWEKVSLNIDEDKSFGRYTLKHIEKVLNGVGLPPENHIRVKYLDRSDIEDLGWKFLSEHSDEDKEAMSFQKGNWVLVYNFTIKKIFVFVRTSVKELDPFTGTKNVRVSGLEVKNKSELKRLIKNLKMGE